MQEITDFKSFVMVAGNKLVTDSRKVAKAFGKRHSDVLRAIKNIKCSAKFRERNFAFCYENNELQNGKPLPMWQMTKDGFMFVVLGFTGETADLIKEAFIEAFNEMADYLNSQRHDVQRQINELTAQDASSKVRASFGSHLMLDRKKEKPRIQRELNALLSKLQLPLPFAPT